MTKVTHDNLPTDARIAMWGGMDSGSVLCACGDRLTWSDRKELGPLRWHCLACVLPREVGIRKRWRAFIRSAIGKAIRDPVVVDIVTDCWTHRTDGTIHTACDDQEQGWLPPTMRQLADVGSWEFDPSGVPPVFSSRLLLEAIPNHLFSLTSIGSRSRWFTQDNLSDLRSCGRAHPRGRR